MNFKEEIREIIRIYCKDLNLDENVVLEELAEMCEGLTGADLKSVVCDALIKAFHKAHKNLDGEDILESSLIASIKLEKDHLISSIQTIKQTINKNERIKLKKMYFILFQNKMFG